MGFACSDARKCIPPMKRFSSSFEDISYTSSTVSFYTAGNQNVDFERKTKNELRNVSSYTHPTRLKCYSRTKTRCINRKIATITERGTSRTLTVSKLKITSRRSCEQIGFQKKWDFECTPEYSDSEGILGSSPTRNENVNSDVFSISRPSSSMSRGETKFETNAISRSSKSPPKVLKAKYCGTQINQEKPTNNDSVFTWENAAKIKLSDIGPASALTSSQVSGETTTQLVTD